jgi:hypothetical protein
MDLKRFPNYHTQLHSIIVGDEYAPIGVDFEILLGNPGLIFMFSLTPDPIFPIGVFAELTTNFHFFPCVKND